MQVRYLVVLAAVAVALVYGSNPADPNDPLIQQLARFAVSMICKDNYLASVRRAESEVDRSTGGIVYSITLDMQSYGQLYRCHVEVLYKSWENAWNRETLKEYKCYNQAF